MDRLDSIEQLADWVPIRLYRCDGEPVVDWCYFGAGLFVDPFFSQTVERCLRRPFNLLFRYQTPIDVLEEIQARRPGVPPAAFVFHVSRCGSTLVSQMLAALPENIVISEAPPIDSAITRRKVNSNATDEQRVRWLRGLLNVFGQQRTGHERRLFVKFDAWNIIDLPVVRRAFPDVPWIFLYRDPVEVLVSQLNHRGIHMVPGAIDPLLFGLDPAVVANMRPEEYCAVVLSVLFQGGLDYHNEGGRLVNYKELPAAVFSLGKVFGFEWNEEQLGVMSNAAKLDAKNPNQNFENDRERKQQKATKAIIDAAQKWLYPVYEKLERARTSSVVS